MLRQPALGCAKLRKKLRCAKLRKVAQSYTELRKSALRKAAQSTELR